MNDWIQFGKNFETKITIRSTFFLTLFDCVSFYIMNKNYLISDARVSFITNKNVSNISF